LHSAGESAYLGLMECSLLPCDMETEKCRKPNVAGNFWKNKKPQ
jgi:hypothetical protein